MDKMYLTQNGKPVGPWTVNEVLERLQKQQLTWTDYFYDESKKDWIILMDHPQLLVHFREMAGHLTPPTAPPVKQVEVAPVIDRSQEWFILKGENKYGPFLFLDVVKMLQEKNLYEFDYVWCGAFPNWKRVSECEEFRAEKVRALKNSGNPEIEEVFFRRRHARARYGASLVVHNNRKVWKAESFEISPGGCGLVIDNNGLEPGQSLFLHFKAGDGVPPFNAICQVVSKQTPMAGQHWVRYGVKFTSIPRQVQAAIKDFTQKAA